MRRALLLAMCYLVTGAGIAAGWAEAQAVPKIRFEKYMLPNGLEVILHEDVAGRGPDGLSAADDGQGAVRV